MEIDAIVASATGWPKTKYAQIERERRWLCEHVPHDRVLRSSTINDLYLTGTQLRVREMRDPATGAVAFKLTRKGDISASARMITTIYLSKPEFALLSGLPGFRIEKTRYTVAGDDGFELAFDEFAGRLAGLILAEVEFACEADMNAYTPPAFLGREVTDDPRYTGGELAKLAVPGS